jgi:peptidyl-prolyl isomerase G (cyclophilin G)
MNLSIFSYRKHVVFGQVIQGFEIIQLIENLPTDEKDKPKTNVTISHCGELIIKIKSKFLL